MAIPMNTIWASQIFCQFMIITLYIAKRHNESEKMIQPKIESKLGLVQVENGRLEIQELLATVGNWDTLIRNDATHPFSTKERVRK